MSPGAKHEHVTVGTDSDTVIPVVQEELAIHKREVESGVVQITKTVHERTERIDVPVAKDELVIERVAIGRLIEGDTPALRHEGDIMIIPVFEEVLVVEKRLMLREEVRITRRRSEVRESQEVVLRNEAVSVERLQNAPSAESKQ
jgi:uncharacterized protein (TIGR02271 family)